MNAKTKLELVWRRIFRTLENALLPNVTFAYTETRIDMVLHGYSVFDSAASRGMIEFCDFFTLPSNQIDEMRS